jgi:hypothetical protein
MKAYKYLGVEENHNIEHRNEKEKLKKESVRRLTLILNTELSAKNKMQATGSLAVPVLRYSFGIINWHQEEIQEEVLERTNLPIFLTLFKNVICIKTSVCPNITLVDNSVPILKHSHIQNNVSNKRIVGSSLSFTILNFNCIGTTANSCISGSRSFIIFLY